MPHETYRLQEVNYEVVGEKTFRVYESGNAEAPHTLTLFDVRVPAGEDAERVRGYLNQILVAFNGVVRIERSLMKEADHGK